MESTDKITDPEAAVLRCAERFVQDLVTEATAAYWYRRAEALEAARDQPGDYGPPRPTPADQSLAEAALACRRHAFLIERGLL